MDSIGRFGQQAPVGLFTGVCRRIGTLGRIGVYFLGSFSLLGSFRLLGRISLFGRIGCINVFGRIGCYCFGFAVFATFARLARLALVTRLFTLVRRTVGFFGASSAAPTPGRIAGRVDRRSGVGVLEQFIGAADRQAGAEDQCR